MPTNGHSNSVDLVAALESVATALETLTEAIDDMNERLEIMEEKLQNLSSVGTDYEVLFPES
jgi:hypothetical protein